jgi:hypothetical protein
MGKVKNKIERNQLWDVRSFFDAKAEIAKTSFKDATAGTILTRSLEHINTKIYKQRGVNETFLSIGIKIDNTGGYADFITSLKRKVEGDFANAGTADKTKGVITVSGEKSTLGVSGLKASSGWSFVEMEQAKLENRDTASDLMAGHNAKYLTQVDNIGFFGVNGVNGIANHADLTTVTASAFWSGMTNVELTDELSAFILSQRGSVDNTDFWCDTVVLPTPLLSKIKSANAFDGFERTIEEHLMTAYDVRFVASSKLTGVGTATSDVVLALSTHEDALVFRIPVPFNMSKVYQTSDWNYSFESMFRIAGIDMLEKVQYKLDGF